MIKRKGQIVPKYLVRAIEKKSQHLVKFGCDVEIAGRTIKPLHENGGGVCIVIPDTKYCNTKKNKKRVKGFVVTKDIVFKGTFDYLFNIKGTHNLNIPHIALQPLYELQPVDTYPTYTDLARFV